MATKRRLLNIAKKMLLDGCIFYCTTRPRMTMKEYEELWGLGFRIQSEWPHPPESRNFYMMENFKKQNIDLYQKLLKEK